MSTNQNSLQVDFQLEKPNTGFISSIPFPGCKSQSPDSGVALVVRNGLLSTDSFACTREHLELYILKIQLQVYLQIGF